MADMTIQKLNETYIKVSFKEAGYAWDMSSFFEYEKAGSKFSPAFKNGMWDGKHRLYNLKTGLIYLGLLPYVLKFGTINNLSVDCPDNLIKMANPVSPEKTVNFIKTLNLPFKPHNYQAKALHTMINYRRKLILSPTSSGKSLMIYMTVRYWERIIPENRKILIVVPLTSLVLQIVGDFAEYSTQNGWNAEAKCHKLYDGATKSTDKKIVVSTWQSIYKMPKKYFEQFAAIICDEAHLFKAQAIGSIVDRSDHIPYRMGTTGTVGTEEVNRLTLEGMFGTQHRTVRTIELMERGTVAQLTIKTLQLLWENHADKKAVNKMDYAAERKFLCTHPHRTAFTAKLAVAQKQDNVLLLYENKIHGHGLLEEIKKLIKDDPSRRVFFFDGSIGVAEREAAKPILESTNGCIIVASLGVYSTGVSIKNIKTVIFGWVGKSSIRVLQSIGRGLRISDTKDSVMLYDIFDNLKYDNRRNYSLKHFIDRLDIYKSEQFTTIQKTINFR